jgi:hypothetical protein
MTACRWGWSAICSLRHVQLLPDRHLTSADGAHGGGALQEDPLCQPWRDRYPHIPCWSRNGPSHGEHPSRLQERQHCLQLIPGRRQVPACATCQLLEADAVSCCSCSAVSCMLPGLPPDGMPAGVLQQHEQHVHPCQQQRARCTLQRHRLAGWGAAGRKQAVAARPTVPAAAPILAGGDSVQSSSSSSSSSSSRTLFNKQNNSSDAGLLRAAGKAAATACGTPTARTQKHGWIRIHLYL